MAPSTPWRVPRFFRKIHKIHKGTLAASNTPQFDSSGQLTTFTWRPQAFFLNNYLSACPLRTPSFCKLFWIARSALTSTLERRADQCGEIGYTFHVRCYQSQDDLELRLFASRQYTFQSWHDPFLLWPVLFRGWMCIWNRNIFSGYVCVVISIEAECFLIQKELTASFRSCFRSLCHPCRSVCRTAQQHHLLVRRSCTSPSWWA